ncbi:MAG: hypothetical protein H6Q02_2198 [Acidobacteria bacterium]|jgi:hypothetical protein|nr:hypothetical protein [Acidobacteriota bacterium]
MSPRRPRPDPEAASDRPASNPPETKVARRSARPLVHVHLWEPVYAVARLRAVPDPLPPLDRAGAPASLLVGHGEVSLIAPEALVEAVATTEDKVSRGWRAFTLEAVLPFSTVGLLAAAARALAEVEIPVLVLSSHDTDHFLVPGEHLGRALVVLHQAGLEKYL